MNPMTTTTAEIIKTEPSNATSTQDNDDIGVANNKESRSADSSNGGESDNSESRSAEEDAEESKSEIKDASLFEQPLQMDGKRKAKALTTLNPSSIKN